MDDKTPTALKASIEHWHKNSVVTNIDDTSVSGYDCALCCLCGDGCVGCPIREFTNEFQCRNTPYMEAANWWLTWSDSHFNNKPELVQKNMEQFHSAAKVELTFLKSLLPKENEQ